MMFFGLKIEISGFIMKSKITAFLHSIELLIWI